MNSWLRATDGADVTAVGQVQPGLSGAIAARLAFAGRQINVIR